MFIEKEKIISPKSIHKLAREKGWWKDGINEDDIPKLLCLIHSEVSEALNGYRENKIYNGKGSVAEELADIVIRVFDMSSAFKIDILEEVYNKFVFNGTREYRHGGKRC